MPEFEILCLANSRKMGGRCVAGLTRDGEWIRPVSKDADGTLYRHHYLLDNGAEAAVLDVIRLNADHERPVPHQHENWEISDTRWTYRGHLDSDHASEFLRRHIEPGPEVLGNSGDRVLYAHLVDHPAPASLALVEPANIQWRITSSISGKRQTRAQFSIGDAPYNLSVTDPVWETRLRDLPEGLHPRATGGVPDDATVFLTISLGEPFQGLCYKLVAAVIVIA